MDEEACGLLRKCLCGLALLAGSATAASTEALAIDLAPGKFDEHCLKLEAGGTIRYRFRAGAAVDFNIHHHRGDEVLYPVKRDGVVHAQGEFRAPASEDYCLMWTNRGQDAVRIEGDIGR